MEDSAPSAGFAGRYPASGEEFLSEAAFQLHELRASLPQRGLRRLVEGRTRRIDSPPALEEPTRRACVSRRKRKLGQVLARSLRAPRDQAGEKTHRRRRLAHELRAHDAWVKRIRAHIPAFRAAGQLKCEHEVRGLGRTERM